MKLPRLPLPDAPPDPESDGFTVEFRPAGYGTVLAVVYNLDGLKHDEVRGHTFRAAYDAVRELYPQAKWAGGEEDV